VDTVQKLQSSFLKNYLIFSYHMVQSVRQTKIFIFFHQISLCFFYLFTLFYWRPNVKFYYDSHNCLSHLRSWLQSWKIIIEDVLTCIFRMTILCVINFAVVHQLTHKAMHTFTRLGFGVTIGSFVSECCGVTSAKWTEWEGELAANLVLILSRRNFKKMWAVRHCS